MIDKIGGAILAVLDSWVSGATLADNIENVIRAFVKAHPKGNGVLGDMLVADVVKVEAELVAYRSGQPAILGHFDLEGEPASAFVIKDNSALGAELGLGKAPAAPAPAAPPTPTPPADNSGAAPV